MAAKPSPFKTLKASEFKLADVPFLIPAGVDVGDVIQEAHMFANLSCELMQFCGALESDYQVPSELVHGARFIGRIGEALLYAALISMPSEAKA